MSDATMLRGVPDVVVVEVFRDASVGRPRVGGGQQGPHPLGDALGLAP